MDSANTPIAPGTAQPVDPILTHAQALKQGGRLDEALSLLRNWVKLCPQQLEALETLGLWLEEDGQALVGARYTCEAYVQRPAADQPPRMRGLAFYLLGRMEEAAQVYRDWLEREPDNPVARHFVAAFSGQDTPQRASPDFLQRSFDAFASQFNLRLRQLGYRIPEQIAEWLHELSPPSAQWSVLDGGCGTGLAGPLLRPWAHRLIGVDLSSGMLEEARPCGAYDDLLQADLEPYLSGLQACHDLIVMADTVVYFGEIGPLLHHCAQALRPGGHLIFSTELLPQASVEGQGPDFRLAPTGRYQHGRQGIERRLHAAGLQILRATDLPVRLELGQAVIGQLVLAGKT